MYDPTKPGYNTQNQTRIPPNYEPTIPDNPYSYSPYDLQNIPTPPKPPHVQNKVAFALAVAIVVLLVVISGLVFGLVNMSNKLAVNAPTPVPTVVKVTSVLSSPTQVPTNQTQNSSGYTAQDLLHDFINAGASVYLPHNNETLWYWSGHAFYVKEHALSSVTFGDIEGCIGGCTPGQVGLWVYSNPDIAINVQDEVIQDEANGNVIGPFGYITPYVSGRCLLLTNVPDSIYKQIVQERCN